MAAELPDAASITAHVRAAAGTPSASLKSTIAFVASGLAGSRTTYRSGDDFREIVEEGPFTTERGSYHGQAWHQNENRETVLEQPEPGKAVRETYMATVSAIATPVAGSPCEPSQCCGPRDERIRRRMDAANSAAGRRTLERNDRYDIRRFPHAERELPVRVDHGTFIVRLTIGGHGYDLILDTGAGGITLDEDVVRELGRESMGTHRTRRTQGAITVAVRSCHWRTSANCICTTSS